MTGYVGDIEKETLANNNFRKVLFTGKHAQLVVMSLKPEEEIGDEVHHNVDQFFRIEEGEAKFVFNEKEVHIVGNGSAVIVPAGTYHNVINNSKTKFLKLYTVYSPPNHPPGTIHRTKLEAEEAERERTSLKIYKVKKYIILMKRVNVWALVISLLVVYFFAFIGSLFSMQGVNSSWYNSVKPSITPPNWIFPVAWNILFLLIAISLYFSWTAKSRNKKEDKKNKIKIALVFGVNLVLNALWSYLFFFLQSAISSFIELVILEISILAMIFITYRIRKISACLLIPYAVWVVFAGILNYLIAFR